MCYAFYNDVFHFIFSFVLGPSLRIPCISFVVDSVFQWRLQFPAIWFFFSLCTTTLTIQQFPNHQWQVYFSRCQVSPVHLTFTLKRSSSLTFRGLPKIPGHQVQMVNPFCHTEWLLKNIKRNYMGLIKPGSTSLPVIASPCTVIWAKTHGTQSEYTHCSLLYLRSRSVTDTDIWFWS